MIWLSYQTMRISKGSQACKKAILSQRPQRLTRPSRAARQRLIYDNLRDPAFGRSEQAAHHALHRQHPQNLLLNLKRPDHSTLTEPLHRLNKQRVKLHPRFAKTNQLQRLRRINLQNNERLTKYASPHLVYPDRFNRWSHSQVGDARAHDDLLDHRARYHRLHHWRRRDAHVRAAGRSAFSPCWPPARDVGCNSCSIRLLQIAHPFPTRWIGHFRTRTAENARVSREKINQQQRTRDQHDQD